MRVIILLIVFLFIYPFFPSPVFAVSIMLSNPVSDSDATTLDVTVSGLTQTSCPNTRCFLQGMYTLTTANKYFGFTESNDHNWYLYDGSPNPQVIREVFFNFTPIEGTWSGQIKVKPDYSDSDYAGPGDYIIRVRRYTGNTDGPTNEKSNDITISLNYSATTPTPTPTPLPSITSTPTSTPVPTNSSSSRSSQSSSIAPSTITPTKTPTPKISESSALSPSTSSSLTTIAGLEIETIPETSESAILAAEDDATASPTPPTEKVLRRSNRIPLLLAGISLFSVSSLLLVMRYLRLMK